MPDDVIKNNLYRTGDSYRLNIVVRRRRRGGIQGIGTGGTPPPPVFPDDTTGASEYQIMIA